MNQELIYQLALCDVPSIGNYHAKILAQHFGTATRIFQADQSELENLEGIGPARAKAIRSFKTFHRAEKELSFITRYGIDTLFLNDSRYPARLLHCYDPPALLFYKGTASVNPARAIAIVGTRNNSSYGKQVTEKIVQQLAAYDATIVSGLAFGIDAIAHHAAMKNNLPTIGVMAHGLDTVYPPEHASLARSMMQTGGILTEFRSHTSPEKYNFPSRNRIVAGMTNATIVIESGIKGGSMITAEMASGYDKDVFAVPGRLTDRKSSGCNHLISKNKAIIFEDVADLTLTLGWDAPEIRHHTIQKDIFTDLSHTEKNLVTLLQSKGPMAIDELNMHSGVSLSHLAAALLKLELNFITERLPGKMYRIRY